MVTILVTLVIKLVLEGKGRIIIQGEGRIRKVLIYIPQPIARDSQFPYRKTRNVHIKVEGDSIIVKPVKE